MANKENSNLPVLTIANIESFPDFVVEQITVLGTLMCEFDPSQDKSEAAEQLQFWLTYVKTLKDPDVSEGGASTMMERVIYQSEMKLQAYREQQNQSTRGQQACVRGRRLSDMHGCELDNRLDPDTRHSLAEDWNTGGAGDGFTS